MSDRAITSGKFEFSPFDRREKAVKASAEIRLDPTLHQFPAAMTVFGGQAESLALMSSVGALIEIESLTTPKGERRTYLGRVQSVAAVQKRVDEEVTRVAEIALEKAVTEYDRRVEAETNHCSYTYASDIAGWPVSGVFSTSYRGTIEAREFDNGLHQLLSADDFTLKAVPHYFFDRDERQLIRRSLASIKVDWVGSTLDEKRLIESARLVMSFLYAVKLRPITKTLAKDGKFRQVSWNASDIEFADRDMFSGPISITDQQQFQSSAIETLYSSDHDMDVLQGIVDRYVEMRTNLGLTQSFAHGCEAIEGVYGLLIKRVPSATRPDYSEVKTTLKGVVEREVQHPDDRMLALSKIDQLFARPTWPRVKALIESLPKCRNEIIYRVVRNAKFFKYRNLSSHGRVVRMHNDVVHQANLMQFVLEWMFIRLCGSAVTPQFGRHLEHELEHDDVPERGIIQIWE